MTFLSKTALVTAMCCVATSTASAQVTTRNNLDMRPVAAISAELGVQPEQFISCFYNVNPAAPGTEPTRQREQANKAILLPCLQAANPNITNDLLDTIMDKYRGQHVPSVNG